MYRALPPQAERMNLIVQKGCPILGQNLSGLSKCIERFEEKVYASAKDEADYIAKISAKVKALYLIPQEAESKPLVPTSSASGAGKAANIDWQEQIYEKVQKLKSMYFTKFNALYRHISSRLQKVESSQKPKANDLENCKHIKKIIENIFAILEVNKSQINTEFKEKLENAEKWIEYIMQRINVSSHNQGQDSDDLQSGQQFVPPHSITSQEEIFERNLSPQVLRPQNYHSKRQISQPKKMPLQEQQVANQCSNSQPKAKQMSITKGPGNAVQQQPHNALKATEGFGVSINTPVIPDSHKPTVASDEPSAAMQRLVKVLTSMSPEMLSASIGEIREIVYLNDAIPASILLDGSPKRVQKQSEPSLIPQGMKVSRSINAMTLDTSKIYASTLDSFNRLTDAKEPDLNSVTPQAKRPRIVENHTLLEEIKEINKQLIDIEVVIGGKDSIQSAVAGAAESGDGLVVKFLFSAVTVNLNLISHYTDKRSIIKPLWLLVPTSYPFSSPVILDKMPLEASEDLEDLWMTAKAKLRFSLQNMKQPWSLGDIAISWEQCAREAILEYAQHNGGGTFSSKYGGWEIC
ncbi:PREDICTED: mediator of RNA polymerase II transcription subunit 15a-like [Lupinus angustifolius]|uniref:mediator of RNA polymerase II transcription subunit 15a-like n=1 Tax=Lupinus angustifolius TaxID=3871 RepID=UPI00092FB633|nr:PREDICTED: mediator of RNA polymerase II transcription subunit 15a-like [Lupinus angustifolius]